MTLGAAVDGYLDFTSIPTGTILSYGIHEGSNSEVGRGTWTSATGTLTRDTVLASTNSGNKITLAGAAEVFVTALAEDLTTAPNVVVGKSKYWAYTPVADTPITIIANGTGDVTEILTVMYSAAEITGAVVGGGVVSLEPNESFNIVSDATSILTLTCASDGSVTIARSAGTDTFKVALWMVWL